MPNRQQTAALSFGLNGLEAALYVALLRHGPRTGYAAAKLTKKPVANCYKALESLTEKGAVVASHGDTVMFSATEPAELARTLSSSHEKRMQSASLELSTINVPDAAGDVFRIGDAPLAIEKARSLLRKAKELVLVDAFPNALTLLAPVITETTARGVRVMVKCYGDSDAAATQLIKTPHAQIILSRWTGQWMIVAADGRELLMALFDDEMESLVQGVWTKSPYLSWVYHYSLASEFMLTELQAIAATDPDMPVFQAISSARVRDIENVLGYRLLKHSSSRERNA
jgi:sugar-specific transcriptional regulator TrmB